jgi:hypothetical protein
MLNAIRKYKILRVIAAFPLDTNFNSTSNEVAHALAEDKNPLAKLSHKAFTEALVTCQNGRWFLEGLTSSLKRSRTECDEGSDEEAEDERPGAKRSRYA